MDTISVGFFYNILHVHRILVSYYMCQRPEIVVSNKSTIIIYFHLFISNYFKEKSCFHLFISNYFKEKS